MTPREVAWAIFGGLCIALMALVMVFVLNETMRALM